MLMNVVIKNNISQIRALPAHSGTIIAILNKDLTTTYSATKLYHGWYFIKELNGWAEGADIKITEVIEEFDPEVDGSDGSGGSSSSTEIANGTSVLDIESIIDAINNKAIKKINCTKVMYVKDDVEYPIYGMINTINQSFVDMEKAIEKMNSLPEIPNVPDDSIVTSSTLPLILTINPETKELHWRRISVNDLTDQLESSVYYANEF